MAQSYDCGSANAPPRRNQRPSDGLQLERPHRKLGNRRKLGWRYSTLSLFPLDDSVRINNGGIANLATVISGSGRGLYVGSDSGTTGTLNIASGGKANFGWDIEIGQESGSFGTVTVDDGTLETGGYLYVGYSGMGILNIIGGGKISSTNQIRLGGMPAGIAEVKVDGLNSTLETESINVGESGKATLDITNGGTVTSANNILIGYETTGNGTVTIDGTGSTLESGGWLYVGRAGTGTLEITGGGTVTSVNSIILGGKTDDGTITGSGTVTVGAGSTLEATSTFDGSIVVGSSGTGTLVVKDGGTATAAANVAIGAEADAVGIVTVENDSTLTADGTFIVGGRGTGVLNLTGGNATAENNIWIGADYTGVGVVWVGSDSTLTSGLGIDVGGRGGDERRGTGFLGGSGTVSVQKGTVTSPVKGDVIVYADSILAPGDADGQVLTIDANLIMKAGSNLFITLDGASNSALVVEGSVTIDGGAILSVAGRGRKDQEYLIIQSTDGFYSGDTLFAPSVAGAYEQWIDVEANEYWIKWLKNQEFAPDILVIGTPNAIRVAEGMDTIIDLDQDESLTDLVNVLDRIADPQELADAFAKLHGEVYAANKKAVMGMQQRFKKLLPSAQYLLWNDQNGIFLGQCDPCDKVGNRSPNGCMLPPGGRQPTYWGTFTGDYLDRDNIDQYSGYDLRTFGVSVGLDRKVTKNMFVGGAFGYDNAYQKFDTIPSYDQIDAFRGMLYSGLRTGNTFADAYAGYTKNYHQTRRDINLAGTPAFNETARSKYDDDMVSLGFDIGRKLYFGNGRVTPLIGLHYIYLDTPGITETGSSAGLHVAKSHYNSLRLPMGVKITHESRGLCPRNILLTSEARMFYIRELADDAAWVRTSFNNAGSVSFLAASGAQGRNSGRLGVGLNAKLSAAMSLRADYDYEVFDHTAVNEFSTTFAVRW